MMGLTIKQAYEGFKKIDYTILSKNTLKELHKLMTLKYLRYEAETNSHYFYTGNKDFDDDLEEFDIWVYNNINIKEVL